MRRITRLRTLNQVRRFLNVADAPGLGTENRESIYDFIRKTLDKFKYHDLRKRDKSLLKTFLSRVTGLSRAQLTRLVAQHRETGTIRDRRSSPPESRAA
ncbi:MAG: hypothetical protein OXR82_03345 [Gammaproteobacteria bacterium]|nr:hypothetical protein [Gammaproteobacteria bacterium]MDE0257414.1 hypothetical protein [Gammaproteobacteria bacterium]